MLCKEVVTSRPGLRDGSQFTKHDHIIHAARDECVVSGHDVLHLIAVSVASNHLSVAASSIPTTFHQIAASRILTHHTLPHTTLNTHSPDGSTRHTLHTLSFHFFTCEIMWGNVIVGHLLKCCDRHEKFWHVICQE